ncbi:hypothetical protein VAL34_001079 [Pseudomonas aeruginosa]|nr:hypothetical protein [Pseudomonas aeruginosa]
MSELNKESAEQAGGDERGALQELIRVRDWVKNRRGQPEKLKNTGQTYIMIEKCETLDMLEWAIERARAALAQPSPDHAVQAYDIPMLIASEHANPDYAMGWNDCRAKIIGASSAVQSEQAEAERPEVVARVDGADEDWFIQPEDETEMHNEGLLFAGCELGRMVDFDHIAGALRADRDSWAEQAEQRLADWDEMRKERDAALARVVELEKQEPFYYFADCDDTDYSGLHNTLGDALTQVADHGGSVVELYRKPPAQAQHSVPDVCDSKEQNAFEEWASKEGMNMECHPLHWLFLDAKTYSARQGWKAALKYARNMLAAAPGKEVGHE